MLTQNNDINRWFTQIISLLSILIVIYIGLHTLRKGQQYNVLSSADITAINLIINNKLRIYQDSATYKIPLQTVISDHQKGEVISSENEKDRKGTDEILRTDSIRKLALIYIFKKYKPLNEQDSLSTIAYFENFDLTTFSVIVSQYPFRGSSFFWFIGNWVYFEILFWSLFGLICNLLYSVSESVVTKRFEKREKPVHLSKLFYTPFIAFIIFLSMDILTLDEDLNVSQHGTGLIVFSYILGFFSRRAVDLLDKIKEIILPGKERAEIRDETKTIEREANLQIIEEAIREKGEEWANSFPNVTGFSVRNKITNGKETGFCALIFKVTRKQETLEYGEIPEYVTYTSSKDGQTYKILTDVVEEEIPNAHIAKKDIPPFELGISVSRDKTRDITGTIGLLLSRDGIPDKRYIISCYHVFCFPELMSNNRSFKSILTQVEVVSPSVSDGGKQSIGTVVNGLVDSRNDFAIAELSDNIDFQNHLFNDTITPKGFKALVPEDKNKSIVLCGRTSEKVNGTIISHYAEQKMDYGKNIMQYMKGLIEISPVTKGGDSGAAVLLKDSNAIIGLVVGGNSKSSYVMPVFDYIDNQGFRLI